MKNIFQSPIFKVSVCFFLSGAAALLYQTAWMRQLSVVFGTSELAVATVLSTYMFGLSLGAAIAAKYVHKITRPLWTYGLLEGGIALTAILVPFLLTLSSQMSVFFLGGQLEPPEAAGFSQLLFYFLSTLLVLVIPTALMGATLPLLTKYAVNKDEQVGTRIGGLYAINTFGAVVGTLLAAFVLLPYVSLMSTLLIGAVMNLIVLVVVINIVKASGNQGDDTLSTEKQKYVAPPFFKTASVWILPVMMASGVATFIYEVLWTRLVSHILGGSVPAFSIMLASFLVGIALGSALATKFAKTRNMAKAAFVVAQIGIASLSAFTYYMIDNSLPEQGGLLSNGILAFSLILPSTVFIGATYPLAVRIFSNDERDAPSASARVYAWNTVGAITGAAFAGYFLIPKIQYSGAVQFAVYLNLGLALLSALLGFKFKAKSYLTLASFTLLIAAVIFYQPKTPQNVITFSPIQSSEATDNITFYDVGRSSTVLLLELGESFRLRNNGLPESSITRKGSVINFKNTAIMLSTLPVIARPESKSMLIAGFGGGVVAENIPPSIESVDIIELEPKVIEANKRISDLRAFNPFDDSRINIIYNDARSALQLTEKKYDVIVSQPSHPWTAGASHLYTQQYMELVSDHLDDDGVFLQWMNIQFTDVYLLKSLSATLADVFDNVRVYQFSPGVLFFLASNNELELEQHMLKNKDDFLNNSYYRSIGYGSLESVLSGLVMDDAGVREFSKLGRIITDDFNILGTRSALTVDEKSALTFQELSTFTNIYSPLYSANSWVYKDALNKINYDELIKQVSLHSNIEQIEKLYDILSAKKPNDFRAARAKRLTANGQINEAKKQLYLVLNETPDDHQFKYKLLTLYLNNNKLEGLTENASAYYDSLLPSAKAVLDNLDQLNIKNTNYSKLESLDDVLKSAEHRDAWGIDAIKMRMFWRVKSARKNNSAVLAKEALALMDEILINDRQALNLWSHELRADAAHMAGDLATMKNSLNVFLQPLNLSLIQYQKPINMISFTKKEEVLNQINRLLLFLSQESSPLFSEVKMFIDQLNSLKTAYSQLEHAED